MKTDNKRNRILEVCCADLQSVRAAVEGGAQRIELCQALELDGVAPSAGMIEWAVEQGVHVHVLIRPRGGDFVYSPDEVRCMMNDVRIAHMLGASGVVIGALTPEGDIDYESPLCLDMELLNDHFSMLAEGKRIYVPKYEFSRRMRVIEPSKSIKLKKDEIVVFEGIHALNDLITQKHPDAFKLYISARSNVEFNGEVVFKGTWFRLVRRTVRDYKFRGADPDQTLSMWANVRRGEKANISPFKNKADFQY